MTSLPGGAHTTIFGWGPRRAQGARRGAGAGPRKALSPCTPIRPLRGHLSPRFRRGKDAANRLEPDLPPHLPLAAKPRPRFPLGNRGKSPFAAPSMFSLYVTNAPPPERIK